MQKPKKFLGFFHLSAFQPTRAVDETGFSELIFNQNTSFPIDPVFQLQLGYPRSPPTGLWEQSICLPGGC